MRKIDRPLTLVFVVLLVWAALFFFVASLTESSDTLFSVPPAALLVCLACFCLIVWMWAQNWGFILGLMDKKLSSFELLPFVLVGFFVDNFTPPALAAGEAVSSWLLEQEKKIWTNIGMASLMFQIGCWFIGLLAFFAVVFVWVLVETGLSTKSVLVYGLLFLVYFAMCKLLLKVLFEPRFSDRVLKMIVNTAYPFTRLFLKMGKEEIERETSEWLSSFHKSVLEMNRPMLNMFLGSVPFLAMQFLETVSVYFVLASLGVELDFSVAALSVGVGVFAGLLTIIPGGLGVSEVSMSAVLLASGVALPETVACVLVYRFFFFWLKNIVGAVYVLHYGIRLSDIGAIMRGVNG